MKFGKLRLKDGQIIGKNSNHKVKWVCDCGKEKSIVLRSVLQGYTTSCNQCRLIFVSSETMFGRLRIKTEQNVHERSDKKTWWVCKCGDEKLIQIKYVLMGRTTSCGSCNKIFIHENMTFGRLRIKTPQTLYPWSHRKIEWICRCGSEKLIKSMNVTSGHTKSCGGCNIKKATGVRIHLFN